jgi:hypothetical protein
MKELIVFILMVSVYLIGCRSEDVKIKLDINENSIFSGTFQTINSEENILESVNLKISNGYYECTTSLPFGYGAGRLEISGNRVIFIDTTSVIIPAIYGPSYVLSGEHHYEFDGHNLKVWRKKHVGSIEYRLKIMK